jgi:hypothetical protein
VITRHVTVGTSTDVFLEALCERNFDRLEAALAPEAVARLLLPRGPDQVVGPREIRARIEKWFGAATAFRILRCEQEEIGPRQHARWRFQLVRDGASWEQIEQTAFIDCGPAGIERIDLLCSGFLPGGEAAAGQACALPAEL